MDKKDTKSLNVFMLKGDEPNENSIKLSVDDVRTGQNPGTKKVNT